MTPDVIIRKERIKIRTSEEQLAMSLRKQLNDTLQYDLIRMMEKVFAQAATQEMYININHLKLDLGSVTALEFEQNFVTLVQSKLVAELRKQVLENADAVRAEEYGKNYDSAHPSASPRFNSSEQQELSALLFFLQKGIFPWWYKEERRKTPGEMLIDLSERETDSLLLKILSIEKGGSVDHLKNLVSRLFIHLPEAGNESIIYRLTSLYNNPILTSNVEWLIKNNSDLIGLFSISPNTFFRQLFRFLISQGRENEEQAINNFIKQLQGEQAISLSDLKNKITAIKTNQTLLAAQLAAILVPEISTTLEKDEKDREPGSADQNALRQKDRQKEEKDREAADKATHTDINVTRQKDRTNEEHDQESFYIGNSGLVLLHPFLPAFFQEAGLLNDQNKFESAAAQQRAAVLLYYLQCGNQQYHEWEMAFNKIICGIPLEELIPDGIVIPAQEQKECNDLLQTVADYWEALKGASIEALQNTFIQREGKISWKEEYWLLQVERTGVDILLERLPWGISTIKFPWVSSLIYTEW